MFRRSKLGTSNETMNFGSSNTRKKSSTSESCIGLRIRRVVSSVGIKVNSWLPFPDAFWELREQVAGARARVDGSDGMVFCWFESSVVYCQGECPEPIIMGPGRVREL